MTAKLQIVLCAALLPLTARAQEPKAKPAYPEHDILTPFRNPDQIGAPEPESLFEALRTMRRIADEPGARRSFDSDGVEVVDDPLWQRARLEIDRVGLNAGVLAGLMRNNRDPDLRDLAFYGAFLCSNVDYVFNLIGHIPGEPVRRTRERAYPRAIEYLRVHVGRTFGSLSKDAQAEILAAMPQVGSPAAQAKGLRRLPRPEDQLYTINLKPFFQLLDLDEASDQAQGLWFLRECFQIRRDLAEAWLEPALPRVRQLLLGAEPEVRKQALGLLAAIADPGTAVPTADAEAAELEAFAAAAWRAMFPPIRKVGDGIVVLHASVDRDQLVAAGREALLGGAIGEVAWGKTPDGLPFRGLRVDRVPEGLEVLGIPRDAVITAVNGVPINDGPSLVRVIEQQFVYRDRSDDPAGVMRPLFERNLMVEVLIGAETHLFEYRVVK